MKNGTKLKLLVLRTKHVAKTKAFYQTLGIDFSQEQHGKGPVHYAGQIGETILEVYPLAGDGTADTTTRLGFAVDDLANVLALLQATGTTRQTPWGLRAVVCDPDGRVVELYQQ